MHRVLTGFALLMLLAAVPGTALAEPSPTEDLRTSIDEVIRLLGDKSMDPGLRHQKVTETIHSRFDYATMGRFILGKYWRTLDNGQRSQFIEHFSRILEKTYIGRVEAYTDEKVQYLSEDRRGDSAKIETVVVSSSAQIPVVYKARLKDGGWYVYDIAIEGVSLAVNYQSSYAEIMRKEGFDGLIARMQEKLAENAN